MRRAALPPLLALIALSGVLLSGRARAQGVVIGPAGNPLTVTRVRALLVFQERSLPWNLPNRQDLLLELELAAPAPSGSRWLVACPQEFTPAAECPPGPIAEVSAYWRAREAQPEAKPWPEPSPSPGAFRPIPRSDVPDVLRDRLQDGWTAYAAAVPEGAARIGPLRLVGDPLVAVYPGALGASAPVRDGARWTLPSTELMILHSHFVNVTDNARGLAAAVGIERRYQDAGVLAKGESFWTFPPPGPDGQRAQPATAAPNTAATAELLAGLGTQASLWLTVVEGSPSAAQVSGLDFTIVSHYPSAVDTTRPGVAFITLGVITAVVIVMAAVLLKRRQLT